VRIKSIAVKNFKCLGPEEINIVWDDIVVLVGENNVGKTSFLQAINIALYENNKTLPARYFRDIKNCSGESRAQPIEITIHFTDLTDLDREQRGVKNRLAASGEWILKKVFEYSEGEKSNAVKYFTYTKSREATGVTEESTWAAVRAAYADLVILEDKNVRAKVGDDIDDVLDEIAEKHSASISVSATEEWVANPGGFQSNIDSFLKTNTQYIFVHAIHDATDESEGNKSAFTQLFNLLVQAEIQGSAAMTSFKSSLREVIALYKKDADGNRGLRAISTIEDDLSEKLSRVISASADIDTDDLDEEKIAASVLPVPKISVDDGYPTMVEDQGNGLQRVLILALLQMLAERKSVSRGAVGPRNILLIEEPELYMHPQMERKMKDTLYSIARAGDFQVICTTHSPIFLDMAENHKSIVILKKDAARSVTRKQVEEEIFVGSTQAEQKERLRMILDFDPSVNEIFFSKQVVLVEGDSEVATFNRAGELLAVPREKMRDTTIINCRGKRTIPAFMRVLNHFDLPYRVLHDRDGEDSFNDTIAVLAEEKHLGSVMMVPETLEDVLGVDKDDQKKKDKPIHALQKVEELNSSGQLSAQLKEYVDFVFNN
jgi:predicted ATP-dependent endonuclease of OLD family